MKLFIYKEYFKKATPSYKVGLWLKFFRISKEQRHLYSFMLFFPELVISTKKSNLISSKVLHITFSDEVFEKFFQTQHLYFEKLLRGVDSFYIPELKIKMNLLVSFEINELIKLWMPLSKQDLRGQSEGRSNVTLYEYGLMEEKQTQQKMLRALPINIKKDLETVQQIFPKQIQDTESEWQKTADYRNPPIVFLHFSFGLDLPLLEAKQLFLIEKYYYRYLRSVFLGTTRLKVKLGLPRLGGHQDTHGWLSYFILPYYPYLSWNSAQPLLRMRKLNKSESVTSGIFGSFTTKVDIRFVPRFRFWGLDSFSTEKTSFLFFIAFFFLCSLGFVLMLHSRTLFLFIFWFNTFNIKVIEICIDLLIILFIIFFMLLTVRDPIKEKIQSIDKWAISGCFLLVFLVIYFVARSYLYYFWIIRGFQINLLNADLYNGRNVAALSLVEEEHFDGFETYRRKLSRWRTYPKEKKRFWLNDFLITQRLNGGYKWPDMEKTIVQKHWDNRLRWRRARRAKIRLRRFKRRLRRRLRKGKRYSLWKNKKSKI